MDGTIWPATTTGFPEVSARSRSSGRATEGMVDYDANSAPQRTVVQSQHARLRGLVERIGVSPPEFKLVDYGCGPGRSALGALRPAVEAYRALTPEGRIAVCHADQPGNDWEGLRALVAGPEGYGFGDPAVRSEFISGSFYSPVTAPGSVALGTCFTAMHWLSRAARVHSPDAIWFADLRGPARFALAMNAELDWTTFLWQRAREIRPGGFLTVSGLGSIADAAEPGGLLPASRHIVRTIHEVAEEMAEERLIDRRALDYFVFPFWFHTAEELRRPLDKVPELSAAFGIEELEFQAYPRDAIETFASPEVDAATRGNAYTGLVRGFGHSSLMMGLFRRSTTHERTAEALAEEFYRRIALRFRDATPRSEREVVIHSLVLRRR